MERRYCELLNHWFTRARIAQRTHLQTASRRILRNKQLGIPVVVLSTIVGASVFSSLAVDHPSVWVQILVGLTSLLAAVLASLQTFLNFAVEAEKHRLAANRYSKIKHDIEHGLIALDKSTNEAIAEFSKKVQIEWDAINGDSPVPDQDIFNRNFKELDGNKNFSMSPNRLKET